MSKREEAAREAEAMRQATRGLAPKANETWVLVELESNNAFSLTLPAGAKEQADVFPAFAAALAGKHGFRADLTGRNLSDDAADGSLTVVRTTNLD